MYLINFPARYMPLSGPVEGRVDLEMARNTFFFCVNHLEVLMQMAIEARKLKVLVLIFGFGVLIEVLAIFIGTRG